jgi:Holliday junction resolvase
MIAELEKVNNRYTYKIVKGKKVLLESRYSYATKSDAIRGFQRFNSAVKRRENIRFCNDEGCFSVVVESNHKVLANVVDVSDKIIASIFTKKLSRERIYIRDRKQRKMYYFIENINGIPLLKPIKVSIEKENGEYISAIENINLFTYGKNLKEVINELKNDLSYVYKRLFIDNVEVGGNAKETKKELLNYLK